jgi:hypothetical protein
VDQGNSFSKSPILPANEIARSKLSKADRFWLFSAGSICCPSGSVCRKAFCLQNSTLPDIFNVLQYN